MIDIYTLAKNPLVFQKPRTITSAYIDVSGKMGLAQTVLMVQDNITENFGAMKMDIDVSGKMGLAQTVLMVQDNITENFGAMKMDNFVVKEKGGFWVVYKAKFKFLKRPYWRDKVVTTSFPADNQLIRLNENTAITTVEGEPIIFAKQEMCCLSLDRHRPMRLSSVDFSVHDG